MVSGNFAELSEARQRCALDRYDKLRPHLEHDVPLKRVAAESGVPLRTAQRWTSRYRRLGLAGLSRAVRADRGKGRRLTDELRQIAEKLVRQRLLARPGAIYREVCRAACDRGQEPPDYHTVYKFIRSLTKTPGPAALDYGKGALAERVRVERDRGGQVGNVNVDQQAHSAILPHPGRLITQ